MLYKIEKNHADNIFIAVMMMLESNCLDGNMCKNERRVDAMHEVILNMNKLLVLVGSPRS
jgi:hypothetical protein